VRGSFDDEPDFEFERYELREGPAYHFDLDRRDFFKVLGGGVVICFCLSEADAQEAGKRGSGRSSRPVDLSARLHIGEDGTITVYTGKVEVGQNIRTSLAQVVAEELRVPLDRVHMVMGDTQLTPDDGGTSGSSTTPNTSPQLRRAAATAREVLLDLAAEHWKADRATLIAADGKVMNPAAKQSLTYGQLTKGQKLAKTIPENPPLTPPDQWKIIGHPVKKADGRAYITGKHKYTSDVKLPGMLFGKVLRPAAFDAQLTSLDTAKAEAMEGVTVVHDGNFVGVAAPTDFAASKAVAAMRADWKTTEQVSSAQLFEHLKKTAGQGGGGGRGKGSSQSGNGPASGNSSPPDLSSAGVKLQQTYTVAYIAHAPLEPRAAVAQWEGDKLTVWTGTQQPRRVRSELAQTFHLSEENVRVLVPDTGSGYGGKHTGEAAVEAARLAKATKRPVKLVWTREEEFTWAYFRPAGVIEVAAGATKDGKLTVWDFHNYNSGGSAIGTQYDVANRRTEFHGARYPLRQGSYRALASTANVFARETAMDELAHALKMEPLEFRLKNLKDERLRAVFEAAAKAFGWGKSKPAPGHGFGIGGGFEKNSYVATCAEVSVDRASGAVKVVRAVSAFECGAVINPDQLKNQCEGALVQGLGGALFEAIDFKDGRILNPHFADYRVPRFSDTPEIEVVLLDRKDLRSVGAGETPIVGIAPAVGNAIFAATGVRLRSLPMVPNGLKV
jgi:isoquinoline 1-oxidoreductase